MVVDDAATRLLKLKRELPDVEKPFLYMEMAQFVPIWASFTPMAEEAEPKVRISLVVCLFI